MVGIEAKAGKRAIYKLAAPDLIELPSVGTAKEFDLEGCAALSPDLVILPLKLKDAAASLTELGIPVLLVNPESQELLTEMIELVSTATNTQERANELLSYIASQKSMLSDTLADTEPKSVYLAGNSSLLSTAGPAMYQSSMQAAKMQRKKLPILTGQKSATNSCLPGILPISSSLPMRITPLTTF